MRVINEGIPGKAQVPTFEAETCFKFNRSSALGFRGAFGQWLQIPVTAPSPNYKELVIPPLECS